MRRLALILFFAAVPAVALAQSADVITVGTGSALPGATINIPVSIRDVSGTPVGIDQPAGSRIDAYSISVNYTPAAAVQSVTFTRAGITAPLTPTFESTPSSAGSVSLLDTFQESTNLIPFTLNAAAPGNQIGVLHITIAAGAAPGTTIALTLDPVLTQLNNQAGGAATKETVAAGNLALVSGSVTVTAPVSVAVPTLSPWAIGLLAIAMACAAMIALKQV